MPLEEVALAERQALCRVCQQGLDQAAALLSQMLGQAVAVDLPSVCLPEPAVFSETAAKLSLGVYMRVAGEINGGLLLTFSETSADWLSRRLLGEAELGDLLLEPASSTLKEVGNIFASAFLANIDQQLGLRALPAPPQLRRAPVAELLQQNLPLAADAGLVAHTRLTGSGTAAEPLQGSIYLFCEPPALTLVLDRVSRTTPAG